MKQLITYIAQSLADNPDEVNVVELQGSQALLYELTASKKDIGKIVGKEGKTVQAIRTILNAAAARHNKKSILTILD